jgi:uncharacterized membrane protein YjfL (UPF0719 family)
MSSMKSKLFGLSFLATTLIAMPAFAASKPPGKWELVGWSLAGGAIQIVLGVALAIVAITIGMNILKNTLPEVQIKEQLKKMNRSVALMAAGVIIAYTKVLSTGISQMGEGVARYQSWKAFVAGAINVGIAFAVGTIAITWAFKALTKVTPEFVISDELNKDNVAIGLFLFGILYGVSGMIASGVDGIGKPIASALMSI